VQRDSEAAPVTELSWAYTARTPAWSKPLATGTWRPKRSATP